MRRSFVAQEFFENGFFSSEYCNEWILPETHTARCSFPNDVDIFFDEVDAKEKWDADMIKGKFGRIDQVAIPGLSKPSLQGNVQRD